MISVLIPVRNMAQSLANAIDSAWLQTFRRKIEIVVADDGSTDHIAAALNRPRPTFEWPRSIVHVCNESSEPWGVAVARTKALERATGDFILPLDADDWIHNTYVADTYARMEKPDVGIVSTDMVYAIGYDSKSVPATEPQTYDSELEVNNITVTSLIRRQALVEAGPAWDHNLRGWEDWDMWLRILRLGWRHDIVHQPLFVYRLSDNGMNAWANQPQNKEHLFAAMAAKHPKFAEIRKSGERFNGI